VLTVAAGVAKACSSSGAVRLRVTVTVAAGCAVACPSSGAVSLRVTVTVAAGVVRAAVRVVAVSLRVTVTVAAGCAVTCSSRVAVSLRVTVTVAAGVVKAAVRVGAVTAWLVVVATVAAGTPNGAANSGAVNLRVTLTVAAGVVRAAVRVVAVSLRATVTTAAGVVRAAVRVVAVSLRVTVTVGGRCGQGCGQGCGREPACDRNYGGWCGQGCGQGWCVNVVGGGTTSNERNARRGRIGIEGVTVGIHQTKCVRVADCVGVAFDRPDQFLVAVVAEVDGVCPGVLVIPRTAPVPEPPVRIELIVSPPAVMFAEPDNTTATLRRTNTGVGVPCSSAESFVTAMNRLPGVRLPSTTVMSIAVSAHEVTVCACLAVPVSSDQSSTLPVPCAASNCVPVSVTAVSPSRMSSSVSMSEIVGPSGAGLSATVRKFASDTVLFTVCVNAPGVSVPAEAISL